MAGALPAYLGHSPVLDEAQVAELSAAFSARIHLTAKAVCALVATRFGLTCTPHAMARLLGRMVFVWKRPEVLPAKADAEAQRAFLDGALLPLMAAAEAGPATRCCSPMPPRTGLDPPWRDGAAAEQPRPGERDPERRALLAGARDDHPRGNTSS